MQDFPLQNVTETDPIWRKLVVPQPKKRVVRAWEQEMMPKSRARSRSGESNPSFDRTQPHSDAELKRPPHTCMRRKENKASISSTPTKLFPSSPSARPSNYPSKPAEPPPFSRGANKQLGAPLLFGLNCRRKQTSPFPWRGGCSLKLMAVG